MNPCCPTCGSPDTACADGGPIAFIEAWNCLACDLIWFADLLPDGDDDDARAGPALLVGVAADERAAFPYFGSGQ